LVYSSPSLYGGTAIVLRNNSLQKELLKFINPTEVGLVRQGLSMTLEYSQDRAVKIRERRAFKKLL
jgi:hypothetical protein